MDYTHGFYIEGGEGNNALSFDERKRALGTEPRLFVPPVKEGRFADLELGTEVVFEDFDEHGVLQSCLGLTAFIRSEFEGVPMVIVDNHNHVFYFWWEAFFKGQLKKGASLVHVDQHKDMRVPENLFKGETLEDVFAYTNFELNVGNYIVPAREAGLLCDIQLVTSELAIEDRSFVSRDNKILNIDLDFFAPELSYIDFKKARDFIYAQLPGTRLITVATSPFFIDQRRAIEVLGKLL